MSFLKKVFISASQTPVFHIGLLFFLMGLAGIKSVALAFLDVSAVQLYLTQTNHRSLGFDFIILAFLLACAGYFLRPLKKSLGYGACKIFSILLVLLLGIIEAIRYHFMGVFDLLFISKYIYFILVNILFWSVCSRFLPLTSKSFKLIMILASEAIGYAVGGFFVYLVNVGPYGLLYYSMALLTALLAGIYILTQMKPVSREVFILPTGEVQDFTERKMVRSLLLFCFFTMTAFSVINYVFYMDISMHYEGRSILKKIALWWGLFGSIEFVMAFGFIRDRFSYFLSLNMLLMIFVLSVLSLGVFYQNHHTIFVSFLLFMILFYTYLNDFAEMLLKTLRMNGSFSLNQKRAIVIEPTGFLLGSLIIYYLPDLFELGYVLLGISFLLLILFLCVLHFYSAVLLKSFKLREWRGFPLMLVSKKVFAYIREEMGRADKNEVIYFLRILEISKHPQYMKMILKSLKHASEDVRLFALDRIRYARNLVRYRSTMQFIFKTDVSVSVRRRALSLLIQIADLEEDEALLDSYMAYLDNRTLRTGAMAGFLSIGGQYALLAMDGLQKMVSGSKMSDKLLALEVMEQAPSTGLIRLLMPLLKSTQPQIANKALIVAGSIKHAESLPIILSSLEDVFSQENALTALKKFGIKAYPLIERTLHNTETSAFRQKVLILFLTMQNDIESKQILLRALKIGNQKLKKAIIRGMIDSRLFWIHKDKYEMMREGIKDGIERILTLTAFCDKYKKSVLPDVQDALSFLMRAITEDISATRELIFYQLLLLNKSKIFRKAVFVLMKEDVMSYPVALGVLQDILPKDLYKEVKEIVYLEQTRKKGGDVLKIDNEKAADELSDFLINPPFYLPIWVQAGILHCLRKLGNKRGLPAVHMGLKSRNPLVLEAAILALYRLEEDEEKLNETLLTVPTSSLILLKLDTVLKG